MTSAKQRRFLKKIKRSKKYPYTNNETSTVTYLKSLGYISTSSEGGDLWGKNATHYCQITEAGRAYLYETRTTALRFTVPVIISICSLAVSVISLLISTGLLPI